jgi:very-short-patch-repair endonuclease
MQYDEIRKIARRLRTNQTDAEKILWECLRKRRLNGVRFLRQYPIFYDRTMYDQKFFVVDFYCPKYKTAIELDGKVHAFQKERDIRRQEIIAMKDIRVIRIKNEELENIENVMAYLKSFFPEPGSND